MRESPYAKRFICSLVMISLIFYNGLPVKTIFAKVIVNKFISQPILFPEP